MFYYTIFKECIIFWIHNENSRWIHSSAYFINLFLYVYIWRIEQKSIWQSIRKHFSVNPPHFQLFLFYLPNTSISKHFAPLIEPSTLTLIYCNTACTFRARFSNFGNSHNLPPIFPRHPLHWSLQNKSGIGILSWKYSGKQSTLYLRVQYQIWEDWFGWLVVPKYIIFHNVNVWRAIRNEIFGLWAI